NSDISPPKTTPPAINLLQMLSPRNSRRLIVSNSGDPGQFRTHNARFEKAMQITSPNILHPTPFRAPSISAFDEAQRLTIARRDALPHVNFVRLPPISPPQHRCLYHLL